MPELMGIIARARRLVEVQKGDHPLTGRIEELLQIMDTEPDPSIRKLIVHELQVIVPQVAQFRADRQGRITAGILLQNTPEWQHLKEVVQYYDRAGLNVDLSAFDSVFEGVGYVIE